MRLDSRLSRVLHVLLHMNKDRSNPMTSETIAAMLGTNSAVIRRTMAGMRKAGYVTSEKGHGGGWLLACDFSQTSLLDIYQAVGSPQLFAMGCDNEHPNCVVEKAVNSAIQDAFAQAQQLIFNRFADISLAMLSDDFIERYLDAIS